MSSSLNLQDNMHIYDKLLIEKLSFICLLRGETVWVSFGGNYVDLGRK